MNVYPRCGDCGSPMGEVMSKAGVKYLSCCDCGCTRTASPAEAVLQELIADMKDIPADVPLSSLRRTLDDEAIEEANARMHATSREEALHTFFEWVVE